LKKPACSYIVSIYKNIVALELIFIGLSKQSNMDFEVIVAEDNDLATTQAYISDARQRFAFPILHVFHPDDGFRKCEVLNKAIAASTSDYLIFTDGDCIPHKHLIAQYLGSKNENLVLFGRRVMLSESFTNKVYKDSKQLFSPLKWIRFIKYSCEELVAGLYMPFIPPKKKDGIWGCNWATHKKNVVAINGFDEDFTKPGYGEDQDIEWRLQQLGLEFYQIKHRVIMYHLWHPLNYTDTIEMKAIMDKKKIAAGVPIKT
jgi:glycosyltransferase involved in cell wall biosynthesis